MVSCDELLPALALALNSTSLTHDHITSFGSPLERLSAATEMGAWRVSTLTAFVVLRFSVMRNLVYDRQHSLMSHCGWELPLPFSCSLPLLHGRTRVWHSGRARRSARKRRSVDSACMVGYCRHERLEPQQTFVQQHGNHFELLPFARVVVLASFLVAISASLRSHQGALHCCLLRRCWPTRQPCHNVRCLQAPEYSTTKRQATVPTPNSAPRLPSR
ncbi:hypothetical protein GGR56DRAFT_558730 [Xylariaceae sp. FL0804]|nr:hypothetical protein GGR56DRAFT_558730 [Xylariaceae sp. FL0804]